MADDLYTRFKKAEKFLRDVDRVVSEYSMMYGRSKERILRDISNPELKGAPNDFGYNTYSIRKEILKKSYGTLEVEKDGKNRAHQDIDFSSSEKIRSVFCGKRKIVDGKVSYTKGKIDYSREIIEEYERIKGYVESILSYDGIVKVINANACQESLFSEYEDGFVYSGERENEVVYCESDEKIEHAKKHDLEMLISGLEPEKKAFFERIFPERIENWDKYYKSK